MPIGSPKAKGSAGELEAAKLLTSWAKDIGVSLDLSRNLEQVRAGGADVNGVPNLEVEVKRQETLNVGAWWRQVCRASDKSGKVPLLMYRQNRRPWFFKVRQVVAVYGISTGALYLDFTMDETQAKKWFQYHVWLHTQGVDAAGNPARAEPHIPMKGR